MAEKLSITIALEGGKQIEQQLEGIGKAGQQAFQDIAKAAEQAGGFKNLKPEEVTQKLKDLGVTGKEALDKISGAVQQATRMETLVGVVQKLETGFAGLSAAAGGFVRALGPIGVVAGTIGAGLVKVMADAAEAISKADAQAIKLGLSIEKFSQLKQGFEAAGLSAKDVADGMSAIGKAAEQARLNEVTKAIKEIQERLGTGLGSAAWNTLAQAMQGAGPAADAAKKAILELGGTINDTATKSLPEFIAKMGGDVPRAVAAFVEQLRLMPDSANRSQQAIAALGEAGIALVQQFRLGQITVDQFKERLTNLTQEQANAANTLKSEWNRVGTAWETLKTTLGGTLLVNLPTNLVSTLETINNLLDPAKWTEWGNAAKQAFIDLFAPIGELEVKIAKLVASIPSWLGNVFGGGGGGGADAGSIPGNAAGGLIGGRGTGTSDSNLAWVSRGEHIMPARAVAQPGVLALLEALRRTGGNLRGVMNGMGRFAAGGVIPRFAAGGLVGGGMGHLGTVDLRTDHGSVRLMASSSAVEQLSRLAVTRRMTSTGRKPGFIG